MSAEQVPITEERLQEIAARVKSETRFQGYEAQGTGMHNDYLTDVPDLVAEIRRLRAKVQEQTVPQARSTTNTADQRDQNLPKPFEEMKLADMLEYMQRSADDLHGWLATQNGDVPAIRSEQVRQALQAVVWGAELTKYVIAIPSQAEAATAYDFEEAVQFILERMMDMGRPYKERYPEELIEQGCICRRLIETVLTWDGVYMEKKGAIATDEPGTPAPAGPVQ